MTTLLEFPEIDTWVRENAYLHEYFPVKVRVADNLKDIYFKVGLSSYLPHY